MVETAVKVHNDFDAGKISNLHPPYINNRKRKYQSTEIEQNAKDIWENDATIPEPTYRKEVK